VTLREISHVTVRRREFMKPSALNQQAGLIFKNKGKHPEKTF